MAISYTPFSQKDFAFTGKAHLRAQPDLYPLLFKADKQNLEFTALPEDQARTLDGDMGTDRIVEVTVHNLRAPLTYLVQERFRRPSEFSRHGLPDITITEWNHNSNLPSELYKIKAGLFVYGEYAEQEDRLTEAVVVSVCPMLLHLTQGDLPFSRHHNKKNQTFIAIKIVSLEKLNLIHLHKKWTRQVNTQASLDEGMKRVPKSYNPRVEL